MARTLNAEQHEAVRSALIDVAGALFARQGFAGTSIAQICNAADISSGKLFHYFPTKQTLFNALFERDGADTRDLFDRLDGDPNPVEAIVEAVRVLAGASGSDRTAGIMLELIRRVEHDAVLLETVETNDEIVRAGFERLIRRAQRRAQVDPDLEPREAARWVQALIDAAYLNDAFGGDGASMLTIFVKRMLLAREEGR